VNIQFIGSQYISLRSFEDVSSALNFESDGIRVVGGCDLYTTKAAGSDKKLYKHIDRSLEAKHESLLRLAASLSPPQAKEFAKSTNLSRASPFGALSQVSNRRTYAYMIATLNASHPDYDFSNVLRPEDFHRETRLNDVMSSLDSKVYGAHSSRIPRGLQTPGGSLMWGPRMWKMMDEEMDMFSCDVYSYSPSENPFDDEETALWSLHYFFFNKVLKRVCYLYVRALSPTFPDVESDSEFSTADPRDQSSTAARAKKRGRQSAEFSARKRARFWLGDRADDLEDDWGSEDGLVRSVADEDSEDEEIDLELIEEITTYRSRSMSSNVSGSVEEVREEDTGKKKGKGAVQSMSEAIAEAIEL
jgi:AP-1 complex subunit sigma 1/2